MTKKNRLQRNKALNHLHIPDVKHKRSKNSAFLENAIVSPLCAENIDAANILGMEISESCSSRINTEN